MSAAIPQNRLADHHAMADRYAGTALEPALATWSNGTMIATIHRHPMSGDLWLTVSHDAGGSAGPIGEDLAIITENIALLGGALPAGGGVAVSGVNPGDVDVALGNGAWIVAVKAAGALAVTTTIRDSSDRIDSCQRWSIPSVPTTAYRHVKPT